MDEGVEPAFGCRKIRAKVEGPDAPGFSRRRLISARRAVPAQPQILAGFLDRLGRDAAGRAGLHRSHSQAHRRRRRGRGSPGHRRRKCLRISRNFSASFETSSRMIRASSSREFGPEMRDAVEVVGHVAIGDAGFRQMLLEPAAMRFLHGAGTEQHEMFLAEAGDGEIAIELALGRQHRGQGQAARFRRRPARHMVRKARAPGPLNSCLAIVGDLDGAHRFAYGLYLARHIVMGAGAVEGRLLVGVAPDHRRTTKHVPDRNPGPRRRPWRSRRS